MGISNYVNLGCDVCGIQLVIDGQTFWETSDCARAEAEDEGWKCYIGSGNNIDHCPDCKTK
ncbi:MAG: hypothetical protein V3R67_08840 [Thermodesulfobacteriota bacterium]